MRDVVLNLMFVAGVCLVAAGLWRWNENVAMVAVGVILTAAGCIGSLRGAGVRRQRR